VVIHYEEALYQVYGPKKPGFKAEDVTLGLGITECGYSIVAQVKHGANVPF